jgi:pimeloyl-ACP methyl ester carboxylesterase
VILAHDASGTGPPAVFLHGLGLSRAVFDAVLPAVEGHARAIRLDLRGHGASPPGDPGALFHHHDDVLATLDALGLDRVDLVGHSLGGAVALDLALAAPARVRRLVLFAPALSGWKWSDAWVAAFHAVRGVARLHGPRAALEAWWDHPLFAPTRATHPRAAAALEAIVFSDSGRRWTGNEASRPPDPPAAGRLGEVSRSTLVLVGEDDRPDFRAIGETLATHQPAVRLLVVPGAGHVLPLEDPEVAARAIARGLAQDVPPALRKEPPPG